MNHMMKAVRIFEYGGPDVLRYDDYPQPEIGPHDIKVRVLATSISRFDLKFRVGRLAGFKLPGRRAFPLPMQLGRDTAGVVEEVGSEVTTFRIGDRVVGLTSPANPMSPMTIMGLGNLSTDIDIPGHTMFGSNAQFVARPESYFLHLPENVSMVDAAAAIWAYGTSHRALVDRLRARLGDTILIIGASGGMGSATLDLARAMGLRSIVTTRSAAKVDFLHESGATEIVVLSDDADTAKTIRQFGTGGMGLDLAIDYSGDPKMHRLCLDVLRPGGSFAVAAGEDPNAMFPVSERDLITLELNIYGCRGSNISDQQAIVRLLGEGKIKPAVAKVMKLSEVAAAHRLLESSEVNGRIVLEPWD